jgi:phytoene dehydrogenase-like protein
VTAREAEELLHDAEIFVALVEDTLGLPGGNIFHKDLAWPFAEHDDEVGRWGTETDLPNVHVCGAGARRGGAVSGIPGRNAALSILGQA